MRGKQHITLGLPLLLVLFFISVSVRLPHINRPLSANYEWVTAHTLVTLQIWHEEGIAKHGFNPIYTFPNPNDHYIKCPISGVSDVEGNYYYVSYPPFAFILPHIVFELLGIYPDVLSLEIFNLALHFFCSLLVYLILLQIARYNETIKNEWLPAVMGASIYLFAPLNLWRHANVYFADILVQFFFLLVIYLLSHLFLGSDENKKGLLILIGVSLFLAMYTEWLGYLLSFVVFVYSCFQFKKHPAARPLALICVLCTCAAIGLIFTQYSSISGFSTFVDTLQHRYAERSGRYDSDRFSFYNPLSYQYLIDLYLRNYFPILVIVAFLTVLKTAFKGRFSGYPLKFVVIFALIPVLLHHIVLLEFTLVHDLALVKTSVFLSLVTGMLLYSISNAFSEKSLGVMRYIPHFVIVSMLGLSVFLYHSHVIPPENYSLEKLGLTVKNNSTAKDTIFFKTTRTLGDFLLEAPTNFIMAPQIQYYSGRCIQVVSSLDEARNHLRQFNKDQGVVFTVENLHYEVEDIVSISVNDSLSTE